MHRAIVTGGTRGIGYAIANRFVAEGGRVVVTGRDRRRVEAAAAELGRAAGDPSRVIGAVVDVRDRAAVSACIADAGRRFGGIDVLVNNAGVGAFVNIADMSDDQWDAVIGTNLTGAFNCSRAVIPALKAAGGGWIVNIASLAGRNAFPGGGAYCASKSALIAFSESLMQEVRYDNIRVTVVMPGSVATQFMGPSAHGRTGDGEDSWKLSPDDVALVVMDLLRHPARSLPSKVEIRPSKPKT
jgi:NAD(P)-dependent dehydrogenase (short-subunit alcohol dehydrogenase family)